MGGDADRVAVPEGGSPPAPPNTFSSRTLPLTLTPPPPSRGTESLEQAIGTGHRGCHMVPAPAFMPPPPPAPRPAFEGGVVHPPSFASRPGLPLLRRLLTLPFGNAEALKGGGKHVGGLRTRLDLTHTRCGLHHRKPHVASGCVQ